MSYKANTHPGSTFRKYLLTKSGIFATGLLYIVVEYLRKNNIKSDIRDRRILPMRRFKELEADLAGVVPYPEQYAAAEAARRYRRGIISAPTGVGKSMIAILIINELKVRTLVVVPGLELRKQMMASLVKAFGEKNVGTRKQGRLIAVENIDALPSRKKLVGYDCLLIDEFHHAGANKYRGRNKYAWGGVYYRFGLTATAFRSNENERLLLESVLSKVIYRITYDTAIRKKYIVPMEAYYFEIPKSVVPEDDEFSWPRVYSQLVVHHAERNTLIATLLKKLQSAGISALCLVKEVRHGKNLQDTQPGIPFIYGQDDESRQFLTQFNAMDILALIGTTGIIGEGVDTKPCEWVIHAGLGKSKNSFMQGNGRSFRNFKDKDTCKIIIFKDSSHKWTRAHFRAQCKILKDEYNIIPLKLELTDLL